MIVLPCGCGRALGSRHHSSISKLEYFFGVQVYIDHDALDGTGGEGAVGRVATVVRDGAAETESRFFRVAEIAPCPVVNSDFAEIRDSALAHGLLPARVGTDCVLDDFRIFGQIAGLDAVDLFPGTHPPGTEINDCLKCLIAVPFVDHHKGFTVWSASRPWVQHFLLRGLT